jgi:ribosomal protein S18 acetylase RimI-like enzyme
VKTQAHRIVRCRSDKDLDALRALFAEYRRSLDVAGAAELVAEDIAQLPGEYAQPHGLLLLALTDHCAIGCVALRRFESRICEMKRLYVQPEYRGRGIGRALARRIVTHARQAGYGVMRLDTLASMHSARRLYFSLGFHEIEPYTAVPLPTASHMELIL